MIVIYNDSFLEKLRRPSNIVTIGSYSLEYISKSTVSSDTVEEFSRKILNSEVQDTIKGSDLLGFWNKEKHMFKIRMDFPEAYVSGPQTREINQKLDGGYDLGTVFSYNMIKFYEDTEELAFVIK